jgi:hypothetical protein
MDLLRDINNLGRYSIPDPTRLHRYYGVRDLQIFYVRSSIICQSFDAIHSFRTDSFGKPEAHDTQYFAIDMNIGV